MLSAYLKNQAACAELLRKVLGRVQHYEWKSGRNLPDLVWTIGYDGMSATIDEFTSGIEGPLGGCTQLEAFNRWVELLKAERVADREETDGRRFLSAQLRTNGIVVVLRTHLPATEAQS